VTAILSEGDAAVIVGMLSLLGIIIATFWAGAKAIKRNGQEHLVNTEIGKGNADKLDQVLQNQAEIRHEVRFVRQDLTDIRGQLTELRATDRDHEGRVTHLEQHRNDQPPAA
jgi:hypothetical protein